MRRVTTPVAGNITYTFRHAHTMPCHTMQVHNSFFQPLANSLPTTVNFSPPDFPALTQQPPPLHSQQSLMAAAGRGQMRLNKVDPTTVGVPLPCPSTTLPPNRIFLETHFSRLARHCRRASGAAESRRRNYSNCRAAHSRVGNKAVDCLLSHS